MTEEGFSWRKVFDSFELAEKFEGLALALGNIKTDHYNRVILGAQHLRKLFNLALGSTAHDKVCKLRCVSA